MANLGDFIKTERERHSWTHTEFGAKVGINSSAISRIEHGTKQLAPNKLLMIAKLLDVHIDRVKVLYYGDKFAKEVYKSGCPETVFAVSEQTVKYLKNKNTKQSILNFEL